MVTEKKHHWDTPREWLIDYWADHPKYQFEVFEALLDQVDSDTIQNIFQAEMDEDGYSDN